MAGRDGNDKRVKLAQPIVDDDVQLQLLRTFCRMRGIELPYRTAWDHARRTHGFAAAVERAVHAGRPDVAVVIAELSGIAEDEPRAVRAIARLRRAAGSVVVLCPSPAAFLPVVDTADGHRVRALMVRDHRNAMASGRRLLVRHGVSVLEASPSDSLDRLLGRVRVMARVSTR
jgi:hypothetical protein